ncbi:hypothetical protein MRX96_023564 [Rhipicephalus microplus]
MAATVGTEATLATKRAAGDGEVVDESAKKAKLDNGATAFQHVSTFGDFKPRRILSEDARTKFMAVEAVKITNSSSPRTRS